MKTYNIETNLITLEVIQAASITVGHGVLVFKNEHGAIIQCLNQGEWKRVWLVEK